MKKILYLSLVVVVYAVYAEEADIMEQPEQEAVEAVVIVAEPLIAKPLPPPVTLDSLLHSKLLLESMQELVRETGKQLQIQFPKNAKNTQLVMELQDKLVALGLPSERIKLLADEDQGSEFLFEIVEQASYQEEQEAEQEPVAETEAEQEIETEAEQE
jgi:hypothetical protein